MRNIEDYFTRNIESFIEYIMNVVKYEVNDCLTRNIVKKMLLDFIYYYGLDNYRYDVICSRLNNNIEVIDQNNLAVDVVVKTKNDDDVICRKSFDYNTINKVH